MRLTTYGYLPCHPPLPSTEQRNKQTESQEDGEDQEDGDGEHFLDEEEVKDSEEDQTKSVIKEEDEASDNELESDLLQD